MDAFSLNKKTIERYENFSRSFANIRSNDLQSAIDQAYNERRYVREPLISLNPRFRPGASVDVRAADRTILADTAKVFRRNDGTPIELYVHQDMALGMAQSGKGLVVTTGTGSGKSLCFFIPLIDAAIRARAAGEKRRTRAIIIYPMNALANSQLEEINGFLRGSGLTNPPVVERYTGQESEADRERIAANPPDILLTNFMMLELLLTRADRKGRRVLENARGLDWLVLDELHTYRGRQGADVAMLVRRLRERLSPDHLRCIGTSATMASSDAVTEDPATVVAKTATMIFGDQIEPEAVIGETLVRATRGDVDRAVLAQSIRTPPVRMANDVLETEPLIVWVETRIGLTDDPMPQRRKPRTLSNSPIDGAVLDVILRKAEAIRKATNVSVSMLDDRGAVSEALMHALVLKSGSASARQGDLFRDIDPAADLERLWRNAEENEKASRARFAQRRLKPEEVIPEWQRVRDLLGDTEDVRRFVARALDRVGVTFDGKSIPVDALPDMVREALSSRGIQGRTRVSFDPVAQPGIEVLHRTHPIVATLSDTLSEGALEDSPDALARSGAWISRDGTVMRTLALLRVRHRIRRASAASDDFLLAEEIVPVLWEGAAPEHAAIGLGALKVLDEEVGGTLPEPVRRAQVLRARSRIENSDALSSIAHSRAAMLMDDQDRLWVRMPQIPIPNIIPSPIIPPSIIYVSLCCGRTDIRKSLRPPQLSAWTMGPIIAAET